MDDTVILKEPIVISTKKYHARTTVFTSLNSATVISGASKVKGWKKIDDRIWMASVEKDTAIISGFFLNGQERVRARTPDTGFFRMNGEMTEGDSLSFHYHTDDLRNKKYDDGEVVALLAWADLRAKIITIDTTNERILLKGKKYPYNKEKNARYRIENSLACLDNKGEWCHDPINGRLYYYPFDNEDPNVSDIRYSKLKHLMIINSDPDSSNGGTIIIRKLLFEASTANIGNNGYINIQSAPDIDGGLEIRQGSQNIIVDSCVFNKMGGYGLNISGGSRGVRISNNVFVGMGAGGIKAGSKFNAPEKQRTSSINIVNNRIDSVGEFFPSSSGILVMKAANTRIVSNWISNTFYTGISVGWTWGYGESQTDSNIIESNLVEDIGRGMMNDLGGIYILGVQPGTRISSNIIRRVTHENHTGMGIYLDEGSSDVLIENNFVDEILEDCFYQNYGRNNRIINNIFADGHHAQMRVPYYKLNNMVDIKNNIIVSNVGDLYAGDWMGNTGVIDSNVYYCPSKDSLKLPGGNIAGWQKKGNDLHSIFKKNIPGPTGSNISLSKLNETVPATGFRKISFDPVLLKRAAAQ